MPVCPVFGGLHRLVLTRRDAGLAAASPPIDVSDDMLVAAVRAAIVRHVAEVAA